MRFHVRALAVLTGLILGLLVAGAPAYAATSADLSIKLTNKAIAQSGKRVTFVVSVRNTGAVAAANVQVDFLTSESMTSIVWTAPTGHCYFSPKETACKLGAIKVGGSAQATISGVLPSKLAKGTLVTNLVTMTSDTPLVVASPSAADNIRIGMAGSVAAVPTPSPSLEVIPVPVPSASNPARAADQGGGLISQTGVAISIGAIVAAVVWFAVGDVLRITRRSKANPSARSS